MKKFTIFFIVGTFTPVLDTVVDHGSADEVPREWMRGGIHPVFKKPIDSPDGVGIMPYGSKLYPGQNPYAYSVNNFEGIDPGRNPFAYSTNNNEPKPLNSKKPISPWLNYSNKTSTMFNFTIKNNKPSFRDAYPTKKYASSWHFRGNNNLTHLVRFFKGSNSSSKNSSTTSRFPGRKYLNPMPTLFTNTNASRNDLVSSQFRGNSTFSSNTLTNSSGFRPRNDTVRRNHSGLLSIPSNWFTHRHTNRTISSRTANAVLANPVTTRSKSRRLFTRPTAMSRITRITRIPRIPTTPLSTIIITTPKPTIVTARTTLIEVHFIPYHPSLLNGKSPTAN